MDTLMCAIQGAPFPHPGLRVSRVSRVSGSSEGRVALCRVQLLLLYSGGGSNCRQFQISRCSRVSYGGFSGTENRGLVFSSRKRNLYAPGLRDDEGCGRWFGRKIFAVGGGEQQQGGSGDDDDDHQSEKEDVGDVSKSGEKRREDGAVVVERVGGTTAGVIDGGNGAVGHADVSVSSSHVDDSPLRNAGSQEESGKETSTSTSTSFDVMAVPTMLWERILQNPLVAFIRSWPAWQQRRKLEQLLAEADSQPQDATKQAALLAELYKQRPQAVLERFEKREYAVNGVAVVLYLRALLATNAIAEYLPDENKSRASGLPRLVVPHCALRLSYEWMRLHLNTLCFNSVATCRLGFMFYLSAVGFWYMLQGLKQRIEGDSEDVLAPPGITEQQPLHVVMVESKATGKSMRFVQELISTVLFMIIFSVMWVIGAAAIRKYVNGVAGMGSAGGMSGNNLYAPKEFNKENIPEKNVKTFNDVKGCDEAKAELEEIVEYLKNPAKFTRLGGKLPKGVLLIGPPGTGKTLLAKAIAGEAGVPFFYRAGSEFEEMFVGVGARRVRSLFHAAKKKAPCIVFIDEIDAVGGSRKQWEGHTKKTLNQLLVEMDGFDANEGIIVLAATNLPETLDPALTRPGRFDRHVVVSNPDARGRTEILNLYLQDKPLGEDVDVQVLARGTPGFSGADLANLVNMAAVKAAVDGVDKISTKQLEFAKDKLLMGTERKSMALTEESRKLTAYHESGHAVVAFNTKGANPIHKATITPRGMSLGMVTQLPDKDETSVSKNQMLARLDVCMGGRVAEEMIFGPDQVTSGARSDLQQATALARHMVTECGMSDAVGPIFIDTDNQKLSGDFQKSIDAEVVRLLKEAYDRVTKLLKKHESDLHSLAQALLEHETLNAKEIKDLLNPLQLVPELDMAAVGSGLHNPAS